MGGLFGGGSSAPPKSATQIRAEQDAEAARTRADERATSREKSEMQGAQRRRRLRRTGGMRLLFSPARLEGPDSQNLKTKLGGD
jgi:hypothetical protein